MHCSTAVKLSVSPLQGPMTVYDGRELNKYSTTPWTIYKG